MSQEAAQKTESVPHIAHQPLDGSTESQGSQKLTTLSDVGWQFYALSRRPGAKDHIQSQLRAWMQGYLEQKAKHKAWRERRDKYARDAIADSRLTNGLVMPPGEGWRYEGYAVREVLNEETTQWSGVAGIWFPPDLIADAEPAVDCPLSFRKCAEYADPELDLDRKLSLCEKYAVCVALYDVMCHGAEKLNPWTTATHDDTEVARSAVAFRALCDDVTTLHPDNIRAIEAFLHDVAADLPSPEEAERAEATSDATSISVNSGVGQLDDLVTLSQVAPLTGRCKRTLETYLRNGKLPKPDVPGGQGKPHRWYWRNIKPQLNKLANRVLPNRFPGSQIIA